jgi:hypothetical protein
LGPSFLHNEPLSPSMNTAGVLGKARQAGKFSPSGPLALKKICL